MLKDEQGIWLTTTEAAARRGLSQGRMRALRLQNAFPSARLIGRDWFLLQPEVDAYQAGAPGYPAGRPRRQSEE